MAVIKWLQGVFDGKNKQTDDKRRYKKIDEQLIFAKSEPLTLGVELELGILDANTLQMADRGPELIDLLKSEQIKPESFLHVVEITTAIAKDARDAEQQLTRELDRLTAACKERNLVLTGTGYPPSFVRHEMTQVPNDRYQRLQDERKVLHERFDTLGMHVHIGMADAEQCVRYHNFFMHFLPHLLALSASSPFEHGVDTGLMSMRPTNTESLPIAGIPYNFKNWNEYVTLCRAMFAAGSIENLKDMWWDVRSSPRYGTLEIRICDMPGTLAEVSAITAFTHAMALWFDQDQEWLAEMPRPSPWRQRENKWRAMRYGVQAQLVCNNQGETKLLADDIRQWMDRLKPFVAKYGYQSQFATLENMLSRGSSAERQRRIFEATGSLQEVSRFNVDEFAARKPLWDQAEPKKVSKQPFFKTA